MTDEERTDRKRGKYRVTEADRDWEFGKGRNGRADWKQGQRGRYQEARKKL